MRGPTQKRHSRTRRAVSFGPIVTRLRIHEPAVTLSDIALAAETSVLAWRQWRRRPASITDRRAWSLRRWFIAYFTFSAAASLAGAGVHGVFPAKDDPRRLFLWRASLCSIGLASLTVWHLAATVASRDGAARTVPILVDAIHVVYVAIVMRTRPPFWLALVSYAPGALVLRLAFLSRLRVPGERGPAAIALIGLTMSTSAGLIQLRKLAIHTRLFDHNATFHTVQAVAFALIHRAALGILGSEQPFQEEHGRGQQRIGQASSPCRPTGYAGAP